MRLGNIASLKKIFLEVFITFVEPKLGMTLFCHCMLRSLLQRKDMWMSYSPSSFILSALIFANLWRRRSIRPRRIKKNLM